MKVTYLFGSGVETAAYASRVCVGTTEIGNHTYDENCDYLLRRINDHHESVLEHVVYSFEISEITRALLQQISRHRHMSLSDPVPGGGVQGGLFDDNARPAG